MSTVLEYPFPVLLRLGLYRTIKSTSTVLVQKEFQRSSSLVALVHGYT
jgi:hypothetical protein